VRIGQVGAAERWTDDDHCRDSFGPSAHDFSELGYSRISLFFAAILGCFFLVAFLAVEARTELDCDGFSPFFSSRPHPLVILFFLCCECTNVDLENWFFRVLSRTTMQDSVYSLQNRGYIRDEYRRFRPFLTTLISSYEFSRITLLLRFARSVRCVGYSWP